MNTIKHKLTVAISLSALLALFIAYVVINVSLNNQFNEYLKVNQTKRDDRIIATFRDSYLREERWTIVSGKSIERDAEASNFTISLLNWDKSVVWEMDPLDVIEKDKEINGNSSFTMEQFVPYEYPIKSENQIIGYVVIGQFSSLVISTDDTNFLNSITYSILLSAFIAVFIIVLIALFVARQLSEPIEKISKTAYSLSMGDLSARELTGADVVEIETLRNSINSLGEKLERQDMLRRRLITDVSHELRNPLNELQTNLEAIIDGILPASPQRLQSLNSEVIRFGKLIDNLNILKQFEAESMVAKIIILDVYQVLQDIYHNFQGLTKEKGIKFKFVAQKNTDFRILADRHSIYQVITNLLHNAIKFTPRNGTITLRLTRDDYYCYIRIRDSGIGIPKEDLPNVFERFYRVDKSRELVEGSGIGLTIVKNFVKLNGGTINVSSTVGKGSTFTIKFNLYTIEAGSITLDKDSAIPISLSDLEDETFSTETYTHHTQPNQETDEYEPKS
ncbi:MAG: HAMP domain-containing histidine kinase [Clostridium sp.]|nr:HAMP domain-containing histidine kinase [Clostridium sp.]